MTYDQFNFFIDFFRRNLPRTSLNLIESIIFNQAAELDRLLNQMPTIEPSLSLQRAVAETPIRNASRPEQQVVLSLPNLFVRSVLWKSALAATLAVPLGFASGFATVEMNSATEGQPDWEGFSSLAFATDLDQELEQ